MATEDGSSPAFRLPDPSDITPLSPTGNNQSSGPPISSQVSQLSQMSQDSCDIQDQAAELGNTELHCACMDFDTRRVSELLKTGASVDRTNKRERSCLHEMMLTYLSFNIIDQAAHYKRLMDIIVVLIKAGLDVNMGDLQWQTPLHYVVRHGDQSDVIRALFTSGVRINAPDRHQQTCLHLAVVQGNMNNIEALMDGGADANAQDETGSTPVHLAAKGRHHDVVLQHLIKCGGNLNVADKSQKTPLHIAAKAGRHDLVEILLDRGADVRARDSSGQTPLHLAAGHDMTGKVCDIFIRWRGLHRRSPLDVNAVDDVYCETPLHKAVRMRMTHNIQTLVRGGATLSVSDAAGDSPLHKAAPLHEIAAWKSLMVEGHRVSHVTNSRGLTAFQLATKANNHIAMSMMRQYGINDY